MSHTLLVDAINNGFPSPSLSKKTGKPDYASIQDMRRLLTTNTAPIESPRGGVQNGHLGLALTSTQYARVSQVPFVRLTDPGRTPTIPALTTPFDEKAILHEQA